MTAHTCADCGRHIPHGMAVQRSRAFQLVTMCRDCGPGALTERRWGTPPKASVA